MREEPLNAPSWTQKPGAVRLFEGLLCVWLGGMFGFILSLLYLQRGAPDLEVRRIVIRGEQGRVQLDGDGLTLFTHALDHAALVFDKQGPGHAPILEIESGNGRVYFRAPPRSVAAAEPEQE